MESKFKAEDFFHPERFITGFDTKENGSKQFYKGIEIGKQAYEIHIAVNDVWSARTKPIFGDTPGHIQSYEKIGYHANTSDLLKGFISSKCKLIVHRWVDGHVVDTEIE